MRKILAVFAVLAGLTAPAFAGGSFEMYPQVGGPARCAGTSTGLAPSGTQCSANIPAGPATITGTEIIPADTQFTQGRGPQTVTIPVVRLGAGALVAPVPLTGGTVVVPSTASMVLLRPAGTLATLTVTLPAAAGLVDGQTIEIGSSQTVTALTVNAGAGATVSNAPTALTVSATASYGYKFVWLAATSTWYRLQ